jgi:hypothetical protein
MALAGRALQGVREQECPLTREGRDPCLPEPAEEPRKAFPATRASRPFKVKGLQAAVLDICRPHATQETAQPGWSDEPVTQSGDTLSGNGTRPGYGGVRRRTKRREQLFEKNPDLGDAPKCERGCDEGGSFDVFPGAVAMCELDGVGGKRRPAMCGDRRSERFPQRGLYGITLFNGYSTIPDAPDFFSTGMSSLTVFSPTITSRLNQPDSLRDDMVGF